MEVHLFSKRSFDDTSDVDLFVASLHDFFHNCDEDLSNSTSLQSSAGQGSPGKNHHQTTEVIMWEERTRRLYLQRVFQFMGLEEKVLSSFLKNLAV